MTLRQFFQIIILSFYSPGLYLSVAQKWRHWGLGFLLRFSILVAIITSIISFIFVASFDFSNSSLTPIINQIPELNIANDKASLVDDKISLPFMIKYPGTDKTIIIVDLSIDSADKYQQDVVVFTKDRVAFNFIASPNAIAIPYHDLLLGSSIKSITPQNLISILTTNQQKIIGMIMFLGIPVGSLIYFLLTLLRSLFYAAMATLMVKLLNFNLDYKQLVRLAIIANVPTVILTSLLSLIFFATSFAYYIQFVTDSLYLGYYMWMVMLCGRKVDSFK